MTTLLFCVAAGFVIGVWWESANQTCKVGADLWIRAITCFTLNGIIAYYALKWAWFVEGATVFTPWLTFLAAPAVFFCMFSVYNVAENAYLRREAKVARERLRVKARAAGGYSKVP
jgi:hypothetical protein